eukprot:5802760-Amphidinium_carterae.5
MKTCCFMLVCLAIYTATTPQAFPPHPPQLSLHPSAVSQHSLSSDCPGLVREQSILPLNLAEQGYALRLRPLAADIYGHQHHFLPDASWNEGICITCYALDVLLSCKRLFCVTLHARPRRIGVARVGWVGRWQQALRRQGWV